MRVKVEGSVRTRAVVDHQGGEGDGRLGKHTRHSKAVLVEAWSLARVVTPQCDHVRVMEGNSICPRPHTQNAWELQKKGHSPSDLDRPCIQAPNRLPNLDRILRVYSELRSYSSKSPHRNPYSSRSPTHLRILFWFRPWRESSKKLLGRSQSSSRN